MLKRQTLPTELCSQVDPALQILTALTQMVLITHVSLKEMEGVRMMHQQVQMSSSVL
jgi:hypothetical protein